MTSSQPKFPESRWQGIHVLPLSPFPQGCPSRSQERGPGNGSREWAPGAQEGSCKLPRTPLPVEEAPGGHRWLAPRPSGGPGPPPRPYRGPAALTCPRLLQSSHLRGPGGPCFRAHRLPRQLVTCLGPPTSGLCLLGRLPRPLLQVLSVRLPPLRVPPDCLQGPLSACSLAPVTVCRLILCSPSASVFFNSHFTVSLALPIAMRAP